MTGPLSIKIGSLRQVEDVLTSDRASDYQALVSIGLTDDHGDDTPEGFAEFGSDGRQVKLRLSMNDLTPLPDDELMRYVELQGPSPDHVRQLLDFFPKIEGPVFFHCTAGWSRSTAAALLYLAWTFGPGREAAAVAALREIKSPVTPNAALVALGDQAMGRGRQLFDAELMRSGMSKYAEVRAVYRFVKRLHGSRV